MSPVQAAGVILFRPGADGPLFLLLKNALHATWGFPKGHLEAGEDRMACAIRELTEETGGLSCRILAGFTRSVSYHVELPRRDGKSRGYEKEVHFFLGQAEPGEAAISPEHEELRWVSLVQGKELLVHELQRGILDEAAAFIEELEH